MYKYGNNSCYLLFYFLVKCFNISTFLCFQVTINHPLGVVDKSSPGCGREGAGKGVSFKRPLAWPLPHMLKSLLW